jgi:hypothetical protein
MLKKSLTRVVLVAVLVLAVAAVMGVSAKSALADCSVSALTPAINPGSNATARGNVICGGGSTWDGNINLVAYHWQDGQWWTIATNSYTNFGSFSPTANANCLAVFSSYHTFLYINVAGTGKSDTSGNVSC